MTFIKKYCALLALLVIGITGASAASGAMDADMSYCGDTTHGKPLKTKGALVDQSRPDSYPAVLGAPMLSEMRDGREIKVWYDIHYKEQSTLIGNGSYARYYACGVMFIYTRKDNMLQANMVGMTLQQIIDTVNGSIGWIQ